ncbi:hypothetical protein [Bradyrhizobium sp. OAE829]|uniref:hypothetical protein n=1 Tax=Bradyrhizobium sp. OAE829 TaxID=2663807 RepID=UPI00178936F6
MGKAGAPKKAKPKPKSKLTDEEQSERFKQTARELDVDLSREKFEENFAKVAKHPRKAVD